MTAKTTYDEGVSAAQEQLHALLHWYHHLVRHVLVKQQQIEKIKSLDADASYLLKQLARQKENVSVCFLGSSGVGKSTLINAVVAGAEVVVPSGGVGPLTARELRIEHGAERALTALYHEPGRIWKLIFALEKMFVNELAVENASAGATEDLLALLPEEDRSEIEGVSSTENHLGMSRADAYRKVAALIVTGNQDTSTPVAYLIDSLRDSIGKSRHYGTSIRSEDESRLKRLQSIFNTSELRTQACFECAASSGDFTTAVRDHATGFLAPLVHEFICEWNCELLRDRVQLVDLPGLGIAGDVYRKVTDAWVRKSAQIVVLVVDSRGIRESDADLLRSSGFLGRLMHAADDPTADPVSLMIVVVKIDDIADSRRMEDRSKKKLEHFLDIQRETKNLLHEQLRQGLREAWLDGRDSASTRDEVKETVIERLIASTEVFPLSAIQYRRFLANDDEDRPFINELSDSGVPRFIEGIGQTARTLHEERFLKLQERVQLFDSEVSSTLRLIHARLRESNATSDQAIKIKRELELFLQPLREEMRTTQGQFRSYLKETLPSRIETLVLEARDAASKDIKQFVRKLRDLHWATIRAAIRRGGTYQGSKQIEIPRDFAQAFEEPIAEVWGKRILREVRQRTKEYADDCAQLVKQVAHWGKSQSQLIDPEVINAQLDAIRVDAKKLATVGREMVNELRESVKERLLSAIEAPIRKKCNNFVKRNDDVGAGVKLRMHELLDDLIDESLDVAVPVAQAILIDNYQEMERDIRKAFDSYQDPLKAVSSTMTGKLEALDEQEEKHRREALADLAHVLGQKPLIPTLAAS